MQAVVTVVVVGAGLAGLAAAFELRAASIPVLLLNDAPRSGGVVVSDRPMVGWVVEGGPDGFLASDSDLPSLAAELGVADRIITQRVTGSLAWDGRRLTPLASGAAAGLLEIDARGLDLSAGFATFRAGMAELTSALAATTTPQVGRVTTLAPTAEGWLLTLAGGTAVAGRGVILAVPAHAAASLIHALERQAAAILAAIPYHDSANASLAYRRDHIGHELNASGFAATPDTPGPVRACTFASSKFAGRAPEGHALLRAFVSGAGDPAAIAHDALAPVLGITGAPLWSRTYRWSRGIPRYAEGHAEKIAEARRLLARLGPITLAGAGYDGAGVSACVRSGRNAARELLRRL